MSSNDWKVIYSDHVLKYDVVLLDNIIKKRIKSAIENKLIRDPFSFGKPLRYSLSGQRSLLVGDYRVIYTLNNETHTLHIMSIGHRRDIYEE